MIFRFVELNFVDIFYICHGLQVFVRWTRHLVKTRKTLQPFKIWKIFLQQWIYTGLIILWTKFQLPPLKEERKQFSASSYSYHRKVRNLMPNILSTPTSIILKHKFLNWSRIGLYSKFRNLAYTLPPSLPYYNFKTSIKFRISAVKTSFKYLKKVH